MTAERSLTKLPEAGLLEALADGLGVLIRFHDREIDSALISLLREHQIAAGFFELVSSAAAQQALADLEAALEALGTPPDPEALDLLAAEYADLFLTHGYRVSPSGSVWLTEDKLERQLPMFDVREWYTHYGISVPNWRVRADDHLVHELQFIEFLLRRGDLVSVQDAGNFMDAHVLPWVPEFCAQAESRVVQPLYRAVMALSAALLEEIRRCCEQISGVPRQVRDFSKLGSERKMDPEAQPFVPGTAASW